MNPESLIPEQKTGVAKHVQHTTETDSVEQAREVFLRAKQRLLQPGTWASTAEGISARFLLYDASGRTVLDRPAQQGNLVRIELPAPNRASGSGSDWVKLDTVKDGEDEEGPWVVLTTRPTDDPTVAEDDTAHFFSEDSTGTFLIRQRGTTVTGDHYGRNELPNTEGGSLLDKARAVLVTTGAYLGLSDVQWSNLVKGLISKEADSH
jgi:hypothetical protein